jgi:hypothetical protein
MVIVVSIACVLSCKPFSHDEPVDAPVFRAGISNFIAVVRLQEPQRCSQAVGCYRGDHRTEFVVDEPIAGTPAGNTFIHRQIFGESVREYGLSFPLRALAGAGAGMESADGGFACGVPVGSAWFELGGSNGRVFVQEVDQEYGIDLWCLESQFYRGYRGDEFRRKAREYAGCRVAWSRLMQEARDIVPRAQIGGITTMSTCPSWPDAAVNPCAGLDGGTCP